MAGLLQGVGIGKGVNNVGPMASVAISELEDKGIRATEAFARLPAKVTADDLDNADRIIALKEDEHLPLLEERFPTFAEKVEFWHIDDAPNVLPLIEQEVMGLVARFLGGKQQDIPEATTKPAVKQAESPRKMTARVGRETKGRRGKGVTTIFDLPLDERALSELAAKLKQKCGTGGTVKDGRIEIQGNQRERVVKELEELGYKVKRTGG